MASDHSRDRDEVSLRLPTSPDDDEGAHLTGRGGTGGSDQLRVGARSPASGGGYLDNVYHHGSGSPSRSYHADLYDDELEHIDLGARHSRSHSDVMTIEETYMNEDADVDVKDVEGVGGGVDGVDGIDEIRGVHGMVDGAMGEWDGVDVQREDPVSRWVEKTFSGEAPAVRTHRGGNDAGGVILMGVPPVVAPLSKKAMSRKATKMKKLAAQKKWLCVDDTGSTELVTLTKMDLTHTLGIQLRDLRLLDPLLVTSYPSAILCRERSLVVNLEYIKMIVGLERCYITNLEDDNAQEFVSELKKRLEYQHAVRLAKERSGGASGGAGGFDVVKESREGKDLQDPGLFQSAARDGPAVASRQRSTLESEASQSRTPLLASAQAPPQWQDAALQRNDSSAVAGSKAPNDRQSNQLEDLPFELRVLEAALDIVLKYMETLTSDLEASAHPALDALTTKVDTENLERVRRVKNRMVRLTTRVETLREVLEKFLDDDADMRDMNLTAKEAREEQERIQDLLKHGSSAQNPPFDSLGGIADIKPPETPHSALTYDSDEEEEEAIEVVEQLLETYFMQADNTWNKLQTLTEYIDDTEDYVNIQLDSQRNQLIRLDLILTCLSASIALITAVTSLFAMNVQLTPDSDDDGPYSWFVVISTTSCAGAIILFLGVMTYSRYKRLI